MDSAASIAVVSVIGPPIMAHDERCLERIRDIRDIRGIRDIMKESIWTACD